MATKHNGKPLETAAEPLELCYEVVAYRGDNKELVALIGKDIYEKFGFIPEVRPCAK